MAARPDQADSPLKVPGFRYLWIAQAISTFGDRFSTIAIPIYVFQLTGSSMELGIAFLVQSAATLLCGLWAGALSDRWNRLHTLVLADLSRAVLLLLIPLSFTLPVSQRDHLLLVYAISFVTAGVTQFAVPAKISLIPRLVTDRQLVEANSLDQGTSKLTEFLGYAAAGFLIAGVGVQIAFVIDAVTFLLSALLMMQIGRHVKRSVLHDDNGGQPRPSVLASVREGLVLTGRAPILRATVVLSLVAPLAIGAIQPLTLVFAQQVVGTNEAGYGLIEATIALGLAIGILVLGRVARQLPRGYLLSGGVLLMGLFQLGGVLLPLILLAYGDGGPNTRLAAMLPFFLLWAVANGAIFLGIRTIVQENAPRGAIGRVFSVINVVSTLSIATGAALAFLADIAGSGLMMLVWSIYLLLVGALAVLWRPLYDRGPAAEVTQTMVLPVAQESAQA